jgi:hypothetical protein
VKKNIPGEGSSLNEDTEVGNYKQVLKPSSFAHQSHSWQAVMSWAWLIKHI